MQNLLQLQDLFKKLVLKILELYGSKWKYKSKDIFKVARDYLKVFSWWFWVIFKINEETLRLYKTNRVDLFLNFIVLSFPDTRWNEILDLLVINKAKILNKDSYNIKKNLLVKRKESSKKSFKIFKTLNWCYRLIWDRIDLIFNNIPSSLKKHLKKIREL